ncbi:MAG: SRPBCC domain-containing protein [Acidimicrobiales bacterium]
MSDVVPVPDEPADEDELALGVLELDLAFAFAQPVARVFRGLEQMNDWWAIRLHPEARTVLEPHPGGAWKQLWSSGGALLGTVIQVDIPTRLRIRGPVLSTGLVDAVLDLWLEETTAGGTVLHVHHQAMGDLPDDAHDTYSEVWTDMFGGALGQYLARR